MEDKATIIETLFENMEAYSKKSIEIIRLKAIKKLSNLAGNIVASMMLGIFLLIFIVMANIGLAWWLGEIFESPAAGFFIVALFYALLAFLVYAGRASLIKKPIENSIIKQIIE